MAFIEKTISSERIYDGKILNLRKDKVTVKNGNTSYREIVEHNGGAVIVAITDENKVVFVKQFRKPFEEEVLELPAGKVDMEEDPYETAKRELLEETGYRAKNMELLCETWPSVGYSQEKLFVYLATNLQEGEPQPDENEDLDIILIDMKDAIKMIEDGRIKDGKTQVGIFLGERKLRCI